MQRHEEQMRQDIADLKGVLLPRTHQDSVEFIRDFMKNNPKLFTDNKKKKK